MYAAAFRAWLAKAGALTPAQRQQAVEGLRQARRSGPDPLAAVRDVGRTCPPCHHTVCRAWGQAHGLPRWRCAACGKTFNALTGTPLARLQPDFGTAARLAGVLGVPVPYLFSTDDELAGVIREFAALPEEKRNKLIKFINILDME